MTKIIKVLVCVVIGLAGLFLLLKGIFVIHPNTDMKSAINQANGLIEKAGGEGVVCNEANQMFSRFGSSELKFFTDNELKDFPAIASLGKVDGIWPSNVSEPGFIKIRVGNHLDGFQFAIINTNGSSKYVKRRNEYEVDSCIYIAR